MVEREEIDRMITKARIRSRALETAFKEGEYDDIVKEAYNVMYMAARAVINHLGGEVISHRQVASLFRKEIIGRKLMSRDYQEHLHKSLQYRDQVLAGEFDNTDIEKLEKITNACADLVKNLDAVMKANPDPIINYDLSDYA